LVDIYVGLQDFDFYIKKELYDTSSSSLAAAILDFLLSVTCNIVRNSYIRQLDPENMGLAVEISTPATA
jgi:hypothetical protein